MTDEKPSGLATAVEIVLEQRGAASMPEPLRPQQQLSLLGDQPAEGEPVPEGERKGPGRPSGARNRRTEAWVDYLLGKHKSPLEFLAEVFTKDRKELCRDLGCKPIEALKLQIDAAGTLAPYLHQKQPQAVQIDSKAPMALIIGDFQEPGEGDDDYTLELPAFEVKNDEKSKG